MRKRTPRQVRDPMACVTKRMPLRDDQQRDLGIAYHLQLQAMLRGEGTAQTWATLACSINVAMVLCELGLCAAALPTILLAQDALLSCKARSFRTARWAFSGDEARLVMQACTLHDEQVSSATRAQVTQALNTVNNRLNAGEVLR